MERQYACPASPRGWKTARWLYVVQAGVVAAGRQLEPGEAGQLHLRAQAQQRTRGDRLHPPEVERVADQEAARVAAAAAQPDAAGQPVEQPRTAHAAGKEYRPVAPRCPR